MTVVDDGCQLCGNDEEDHPVTIESSRQPDIVCQGKFPGIDQ